jgi:uncharacterized protein YdaT
VVEPTDTNAPELNELTEPSRGKAREILGDLLADGVDRREAVRRAIAAAREWEHSRVPNVASPDAKRRAR